MAALIGITRTVEVGWIAGDARNLWNVRGVWAAGIAGAVWGLGLGGATDASGFMAGAGGASDGCGTDPTLGTYTANGLFYGLSG